MQLKAQLGQDRSCPGQRRGGLIGGAAQHNEVIRIADKHPIGLGTPLPVKLVEHDVGQERGDDPALGRPSDRRLDLPLDHDTCREPATHELQHPPVRHPSLHEAQDHRVVDAVEEVADIGLRHPPVPLRVVGPDDLQRHGGRA